MSDEPDPGGKSFGRRLERWVRDSTELRAVSKWARGVPATPEEASLLRYRRSRSAEVALPHPAISPHRHDALSRRHRDLTRRLLVSLLLVAPLLVVLGVVVEPVAAQVLVWALLVPLTGLALHHGRALGRLHQQRHLTLKGGLADAWSDWVAAREQLEALDGAAQSRSALAANEARMQALVLALGQADARPDHQDTEEHAASREWVYRSAAKAMALAEAERELEAATQRHVDAGDLQLAPEGDPESLDLALDTTRALTRGMDEPPGRS